MIRVGLVGISNYARWHLLMLIEQALLGRIKLAGAVVINQTEEAELCGRLGRHGVKIYSSLDAMLADPDAKLELVLLPTGIHHHATMTIAALRAGCHVYVEKPLAATLEEVDAIEEAARRAGRHVAVGFQDLYVPLVHDIKARLLDGDLGTPRRIVVRAQWPRPLSYYQRNGWAGCLKVGERWVLDSPVNNAYAHFAMLALFWAGKEPGSAAEVVGLEGSLLRAQAIESFDTVSVRASTEEGVTIEFHGTHSGTANLPPSVRVICTEGEVNWVYEKDCTITRPGCSPEVLKVPSQLETRLSVLDSVVALVQGERRFVVTPALARAHTALVNALHGQLVVQDVPSKHLEGAPGGEPPAVRIREVDIAIERAVRENCLLCELGLDWAPPTGVPAQVAGC